MNAALGSFLTQSAKRDRGARYTNTPRVNTTRVADLSHTSSVSISVRGKAGHRRRSRSSASASSCVDNQVASPARSCL